MQVKITHIKIWSTDIEDFDVHCLSTTSDVVLVVIGCCCIAFVAVVVVGLFVVDVPNDLPAFALYMVFICDTFVRDTNVVIT